MITLPSLLAYGAALAIAAAIPGPGVIALVARTLGSGFRQGVAFLAGLILADLVYLAAACFGLSMVAQAFGGIFVVIRTGAAAYLAYLAFRLWRCADAPIRIDGLSGERSTASFAAGLMVTLSNPKTIFFYLALLPTILDLAAVRSADFLMLAIATASILACVLMPYAILAARARHVLAQPTMLARLHRGAAAILAGAAVWTLLRRV